MRRLLLVPVVALTVACSACGGGSPSASSTSTVASAQSRTCEQVTAVLSDGPDPTADPVGYAEAQVLPLQGIETSDATLAQAIAALANAYERQFHDDGATEKAAVASAEQQMNELCPDAAP